MVVLTPVLASAEDTFDIVLERLQFKESQHFHYQETRHLALLTQPWVATGELFITPEGMIIAQQSPTSILTKITENKLKYFDDERDVRRSIHLKRPFDVPGMAPFLQMLFRDKQQSSPEEHYNISFSLEQERWLLVLSPRLADRNKIKAMTLSGSQGKGPDFLNLEYTDGDQTEWKLSLLTHGHDVANILQKALDKINEEDDFED